MGTVGARDWALTCAADQIRDKSKPFPECIIIIIIIHVMGADMCRGPDAGQEVTSIGIFMFILNFYGR